MQPHCPHQIKYHDLFNFTVQDPFEAYQYYPIDELYYPPVQKVSNPLPSIRPNLEMNMRGRSEERDSENITTREGAHRRRENHTQPQKQMKCGTTENIDVHYQGTSEVQRIW